MAGKNTAVFGIYKTANQAEQTVDRLLAAGFTNDDISVLLQDNKSSKDFAHEKNTKAPEGTTTGVTAGGVIGGTLGLLAGIGALAIPGVGPFIAAGPIMGALAGLGVGGAVGGLIGALVGMGIPEYEAKRYEGRISRPVQKTFLQRAKRARIPKRPLMRRSSNRYRVAVPSATRY
jgi:hypothetical protein